MSRGAHRAQQSQKPELEQWEEQKTGSLGVALKDDTASSVLRIQCSPPPLLASEVLTVPI